MRTGRADSTDGGLVPVRAHYWGEHREALNLGDALVPHILRAFGCRPVPDTSGDALISNPGRCLVVIGSLLTQSDVVERRYPLDVWGCGWKGQRAAPLDASRYRCFAVRGPLTRQGLGLPADTPLGDPALLMPMIWPKPSEAHGETVVMPHYGRVEAGASGARRRATGADRVVSPLVQRDLRATTFRARRMRLRLAARALRTGIGVTDAAGAVEVLSGARFVLTGSLHGAILAQTYGVPWACYYDGYLDAPAKWLDWAAYLGVRLEAVQTVRDGWAWWRREGERGRIGDLEPLRQAFPYRRLGLQSL